ncbi:MAG: hypothetical protein K2H30_03875 [Clostridia bacterium]|nr:hypothetical protein [Clostridia bacterium]
MKKYLTVFFAALTLLFCCGCVVAPNGNKPALGVWWWDGNLSADTYLSFAEENGVTEVYYCDDGFNGQSASFIKNAADRGMKVYWLAGEYQWLRNDEPMYALIDGFVQFQSNSEYRFEGIHLDVEPHQDPDFERDRALLINSLVSLAYGLSVEYPDIKFEYDPFGWTMK